MDNPQWHEILGNNCTATEIVAAAGTADESELAAYVQDMARDIWQDDYDPTIDYLFVARDLLNSVEQEREYDQNSGSRFRQKNRRDKLNNIAISHGFDSWGKMETAVLNNENILCINIGPSDIR